MDFKIVLLSIEPLKASETRDLTTGGRLLTWAAANMDSAYSALAINIFFLI